MKKSMYQLFGNMKNNMLIGMATVVIAICAAACGGTAPVVTNHRMTQSTSTRVDLANSVAIVPTIANLQVNPNHVTATLSTAELESLTEEQAKRTVVSKALATVSGDVMIAPRFVIEREEGKMKSVTVTGYAATITSFEPKKAGNVHDSLLNQPKQKPSDIIAVNTMTVAEVEYGAKSSISLSASELTGKDQLAALELAKSNLLRKEKADVLFADQYTFSTNNGILTAFTLTAFPGKYANYRQTTWREQLALNPTPTPVVEYQAIAADIKPTTERVQLKFGTGNVARKESELKEQARSAVLQKYNADLLLNETFYFDYSENIITHVTICGTPAIYTNFHILKEDEVVDTKIAPQTDTKAENETTETAPTEQTPQSILGGVLSLFKK